MSLRVFGRGFAGLIFIAAGGAALLMMGCGTAQPRWPWWAAEDSAAVRDAMVGWRGYLDAANVLSGAVVSDTGWLARLVSSDSVSATGDTLYKVRQLVGMRYEATDSGHADVFEFGPSVDTLEMSDTFCFVSYYDSMSGCRLHIDYDSLWVVGYAPDTQIQGEPPETLVTWRASYTERRGFAEPQHATKTWAWKAFRALHLPKDAGATRYSLSRLTGFEVTAPNAEDAPDVADVVLYRPGRSDTVFDRPRSDLRGLMNLRSLDSLYTFDQGDEVRVVVELRSADPAVFLAGCNGNWQDITAGSTLGDGSIVLADTGYQHIFVQVLPAGYLFYPDADHYANVWAIPVRVNAP